MVERELPKLVMRVRSPLPAPINKMHPCGAFLLNLFFLFFDIIKKKIGELHGRIF